MASVTYKAPKGDDRVVDMRGISFFDGKAVDLDDEDHADFIEKLRNNPHFEVEGGKVKKQPRTKEPVAGLKAVHVAGGRFVIKKDGEVIKEGLNKADADAFNGLTDDEKAAYVAE